MHMHVFEHRERAQSSPGKMELSVDRGTLVRNFFQLQLEVFSFKSLL